MVTLTDLNEDSLSFLDPASFAKFELSGNMPLLHSNMLLSFRTRQERALVFYLHDHLNNFLQLDVGGKDIVTISFNDDSDIIEVNVTVPGDKTLQST